MSIKKQFLKTKPLCKVTFRVPKKVANGAESVAVVGDFNNWQPGSHPMTHLKAGGFSTTIELEKGKEYQFRYLFDGEKWENEAEADKLAPTPFADAQNSVIVL